MNISDSEEKTHFLKRLFEETYISDIVGRHSALRYDIKGKKYIDTPVKYYFTDLGLRNARLNFRQLEETHTMENVIFNELKIRGFNVDVGVVTLNGRFRFVSELQNIEPKAMEREFCSIIIDKRKKKEILNELCTLGIDESYVYPELQYTAKKIKETYL